MPDQPHPTHSRQEIEALAFLREADARLGKWQRVFTGSHRADCECDECLFRRSVRDFLDASGAPKEK